MFAKLLRFFTVCSRVKKLEYEYGRLDSLVNRLRDRLNSQILDSIKVTNGDFVNATYYPGNGTEKKFKGMVTDIQINDYGTVSIHVQTQHYGLLINSVEEVEKLKCSEESNK